MQFEGKGRGKRLARKNMRGEKKKRCFMEKMIPRKGKINVCLEESVVFRDGGILHEGK